MQYSEFLEQKRNVGADSGFEPVFMPEFLFDFQKSLVEWSVKKGRSAIFADCGMGKTPMELVCAENYAIKTGKPSLIIAPLAVSCQIEREAKNKFNVYATRSTDGTPHNNITLTNYEKIHLFNPYDYGAVILDESSILKSFNGKRKAEITRFMRKTEYRLLATATAAPNDYVELGTSSEALGYMGHMDMLGMFFKNDQNNVSDRRMYGEATKWCFRDCAEKPFWRWVTHWARAMRKPSDIGFNDGSFILPKLTVDHHLVETNKKPDGFLFNLPAVTLREQREERKRTLPERCQKMAELVNHNDQAIVWCTLNDEGTTLQKNISDSVEVSGRDSDESKEQKFLDFAEGNIRVLITKPKIGAWGLNFQNCAHVCLFPTHSYEQYYQEIRRCWRFGQKRPVKVDVVFTEGERKVLQNMVRKQKQADNMFSNLVKEMNNSNLIDNEYNFSQKASVPQWL